MAKFMIKKLPPHWLYVPSKREMRDLLKRLTAKVRVVDYDGSCYGKKDDTWLSIGFVEARVTEEGWCFFIRLHGLRESVVGPVREQLSQAVLWEMEQHLQRVCATASGGDDQAHAVSFGRQGCRGYGPVDLPRASEESVLVLNWPMVARLNGTRDVEHCYCHLTRR